MNTPNNVKHLSFSIIVITALLLLMAYLLVFIPLPANAGPWFGGSAKSMHYDNSVSNLESSTVWSAINEVSSLGIMIDWAIVDDDTDTSVARCKKGFVFPYEGDWNIVDAYASIHTTGATSGATTVQLIRRREGVEIDVFSTQLTITYNEYTASDEVINSSNDDLQAGDVLYPNVTAVANTAAKGLSFTVIARKR